MVGDTKWVQLKCGRFGTRGANLFIFWRYNIHYYGLFGIEYNSHFLKDMDLLKKQLG